MSLTRRAVEEKLYREYMEFFAKAERERRWNVFDDIPWDKANPNVSDELALCAETFASVEMYLPDYVAGGINVVRDYFGRAWFQANWGYEESKHSLALGEWLQKSGKRTKDDWFDLQERIFSKQWEKPFMTAIVTFEDIGGKTRYTARARHWTVADREAHEKMGFHEGWGQCADQLAALVAKI